MWNELALVRRDRLPLYLIVCFYTPNISICMIRTYGDGFIDGGHQLCESTTCYLFMPLWLFHSPCSVGVSLPLLCGCFTPPGIDTSSFFLAAPFIKGEAISCIAPPPQLLSFSTSPCRQPSPSTCHHPPPLLHPSLRSPPIIVAVCPLYCGLAVSSPLLP